MMTRGVSFLASSAKRVPDSRQGTQGTPLLLPGHRPQLLVISLIGRQEEVRQETQRVYKLYVDGKLDGDGFTQFYKPLQERQRQLDDEVPRVQAEVDLLKINHLSADQVLTE